MKQSFLPLAAFGLVVCGCSDPAAKVVGTWTGRQGSAITFAKEKTWSAQQGMVKVDGDWKLDGDQVTMTPTKVNGESLADFKAKAMKNPMVAANPMAKQMMDKIGDPSTFKMDADGKTLTGSQGGQSVTLTKQEAK